MRPQYRFACAACDASFVVDDAVRGDLLTDGCLHCGAAATPSEFTPLRDTPSSVAPDAD